MKENIIQMNYGLLKQIPIFNIWRYSILWTEVWLIFLQRQLWYQLPWIVVGMSKSKTKFWSPSCMSFLPFVYVYWGPGRAWSVVSLCPRPQPRCRSHKTWHDHSYLSLARAEDLEGHDLLFLSVPGHSLCVDHTRRDMIILTFLLRVLRTWKGMICCFSLSQATASVSITQDVMPSLITLGMRLMMSGYLVVLFSEFLL